MCELYKFTFNCQRHVPYFQKSRLVNYVKKRDAMAMTWWQAIILGIVEGVTEYLPVSSTGHLILTAWLLGFGQTVQQWQASFTFNILIQVGAIAAVLVLYRQRIRQMLQGLGGKDPAGRKLAFNLVIAFLPAAFLGPLLNDTIEAKLNSPWAVVIALAVGGVLMGVVSLPWVTRRLRRRALSIEQITWQMAVLIGIGQCFAMWPGMSRSMTTIVAALLLGVRIADAAEFSFLLGLITLTAATAYKTMQGGSAMLSAFGLMPILIGLVVAAVFAAVAIKSFVHFLTRHSLGWFGLYRVLLAVVIGLLLLTGWVKVPAGL